MRPPALLHQDARDGNERRGRAALERDLEDRPVAEADVASVMDRPADVARRLIKDLSREGLITRVGDELRLP